MKGFFCEFPKKSDYENSKSQISNPDMSIVAQPMATITQPINNMGNQFAQAPYGQAFLIPSNGAMLNSTEGQVSAGTITSPPAKPEVKQASESITHQLYL